MKAVCILGSPKSCGNTSVIVSEIIRGLEKHDVEVTRYLSNTGLIDTLSLIGLNNGVNCDFMESLRYNQ